MTEAKVYDLIARDLCNLGDRDSIADRTQEFVTRLRLLAAFQDEQHRKLILDATDHLETLQSFLDWRTQLLADATRYFDVIDDTAVAYFKALDRQGLTYKYGENVNPAHKKKPKFAEHLPTEHQEGEAL